MLMAWRPGGNSLKGKSRDGKTQLRGIKGSPKTRVQVVNEKEEKKEGECSVNCQEKDFPVASTQTMRSPCRNKMHEGVDPRTGSGGS